VAPPVLHLLSRFSPDVTVAAINGLDEAQIDLVDYSSALSIIVSLFGNATPALADWGTSA